jgi:hypothetical protein
MPRLVWRLFVVAATAVAALAFSVGNAAASDCKGEAGSQLSNHSFTPSVLAKRMGTTSANVTKMIEGCAAPASASRRSRARR